VAGSAGHPGPDEGETMLKLSIAAVSLALAAGAAPVKDEFGTAKEAEALVAKAAASLRTAGPQKTYEAVTSRAPGFADRDLYVTIYDLDGKCLAHGQNPKMVGKDLIDLRDADGRPFIKERIEAARAKGKLWQDYKWTDPVTRKLLDKSTYCERHDGNVLCVGIYKR
jgi:cytochrome c